MEKRIINEIIFVGLIVDKDKNFMNLINESLIKVNIQQEFLCMFLIIFYIIICDFIYDNFINIYSNYLKLEKF